MVAAGDGNLAVVPIFAPAQWDDRPLAGGPLPPATLP